MNFSDEQIMLWIGSFLWPLIRIGAMLSIAPLVSQRNISVRVRGALAILLAIAISPTITADAAIDPFGLDTWLVVTHQIIIGLAMGLILRFVFSSLEVAGHLIGILTGLGFAQFIDPGSGVPTPAVGRFYTVIGSLLFLSLNGHIVLILLVAKSFEVMPVSLVGLSTDSVWQLLEWAAVMFTGGVVIALPAVAALLLVNVGFGVMTRAAPQFNIFSVGFAITISLGFIVVMFSLPYTGEQFVNLLEAGFEQIDQLELSSGAP
ncbi:flagellar biosynthetic protein FliR [Gammaproteobacteria bacterium AH-315-C21]|nr:flagellar biosynthetic protein FliR [Gammaproteobacteria bacterium AH-315-C21]